MYLYPKCKNVVEEFYIERLNECEGGSVISSFQGHCELISLIFHILLFYLFIFLFICLVCCWKRSLSMVGNMEIRGLFMRNWCVWCRRFLSRCFPNAFCPFLPSNLFPSQQLHTLCTVLYFISQIQPSIYVGKTGIINVVVLIMLESGRKKMMITYMEVRIIIVS